MGVVDFSRGGMDFLAGYKITPYAGIPIYYYCCETCGFVFTEAFDKWSFKDFSEKIYNDEYALHDPEYLSIRPRMQASVINALPDEIKSAKILDYGSGLGILEEELKSLGFACVDSYDPFTNRVALAPHSYDIVFAFEVFEHHPKPLELFQEIMEYLNSDGVILFSTLVLSKHVIKEGIENWWYCSPRNGHISFFSIESLAYLARLYQFEYLATIRGDEWHVMFNHRNTMWKNLILQ